MKNKSTFLFLILSIIISPLIAQTAYEWDHHGIGFKITEDFTVSTNNSNEFSAASSDGQIGIAIIPWQDEEVSEEDLEDTAIEIALDMLDKKGSEVDGDNISIHDFTGYYVISANSAGNMMLIALLLDKESATNIVVAIDFLEGNENEAVEILNSFYAYD